ncbi:MAG: CCA tRNA nucleotidyltransferase [Halobacteriales archaeon]
MPTFEDVADRVLKRVEPSESERRRLQAATEALTDRAEDAIADLPVEAEPLLVGSTARDTWLAGDRDIDLFVRFPTALSREELTEYGLAVGHAVLPDGREEYAEHPYVTGAYDGFDVDLVPCYDVDSAREIESAVDRTPFHTAYLRERLTPDLAAEARVLKQFCTGIGVYGSDLRTRGFSGYLIELLVLEFGAARSLIEAAADWHPPVALDPEDHGERSFDDPLAVIDPTDPTRNVAAVLSAANLARLQHHARDVLADPRIDVFFPDETDPLSPEAIRKHVARRGTTPIALVFEAPDLVEDELYPQLRKSLAGIGDELDRRGFDVLRREALARERAVLLFELAIAERPAVERHEGPPVAARDHAAGFYAKYDDADVYGPFVERDRYIVERDREFASAVALLESDALFDTRLGPAVEDALEAGYEVLQGEAIAELAGEFGADLAEYFDPGP